MRFDFIENIKMLPIYLLLVGTFGQASLEKFLSRGVPEWFRNQFQKTFLNIFPGSLTLQYYGIAVLEASIVVLFIISGVNGEFLAGHSKEFLKLALVVSLFTFFGLGFGLRVTGDYQGAANLFSYFGVTLLAFFYVEMNAVN